MRVQRWFWSIFLAANAFVASIGFAQSVDPAEERSATFQPMQGAVDEAVPGGTLMVAAYAAIWVLLLLYVWRLSKLNAQNARAVQALRQDLSER